MKLLSKTTNYDETIEIATNLDGNYNKPVIFHCYWNGDLSEKHLHSVSSCYYFNVFNNKNHRIILWLENNTPNHINKEISKYCEIKQFSLKDEIKDSWLENNKPHFVARGNNIIQEEANYYRLLLLYNYGGCWFDLDCFFLRSFDPIFKNYENEICVHQWEKQKYPGNGIVVSLFKKSNKLKKNIQFIIKRNRGWSFQRAKLTYNLPLDLLVLPCSWISPDWIENPYNVGWDNFFKNSNKKYNFDNFYRGAFCYHWHNRWNMKIEENSIINQLSSIIKTRMQEFK